MAEPRETEEEATARRAKVARRLLDGIIETKSGNDKAFGEIAVKLKWQGGVLTHVNVTDSADYK